MIARAVDAWTRAGDDDARARARLVADLVVGAYFDEDGDRRRAAALAQRRAQVESWLRTGGPPPAALRSLQARALARRPFHWPLEFPEVFLRAAPGSDRAEETGGFDAVLGNPPFMGQSQMPAELGEAGRGWLLDTIPGPHGKTDLVAYFLRRARALLGECGALGLITTNTVAQGDTREAGLAKLVADGGRIYEAWRSREWPGAAAVSVSVVHVAFGDAAAHAGAARLDGERCELINSRLHPAPERPPPIALRANHGKSYLGNKIYGQGFVLTPARRAALIEADPRNAARIFPYLGGEEINTSPTHDFARYVIDFGAMTLEQAGRWPALLEIVRETVQRERAGLKRRALRERWWQYGEKQLAMRRSIAGLPRCLVNSQVSKHLVFAFQPTDRVFSHALYVYPLTSYAAFAALQSRVHAAWAWRLSSSLRGDLRYTPTDCFETFPFPPPSAALERAGAALYRARAAFMIETGRGLTRTYNALKDPRQDDPALARLRGLHLAVDRAALAAYGWSELAPPPFVTPVAARGRAAARGFEDAVLERLFALNLERAADEARARAG
ncbi:MAG: hypothetical protein H6713_23350 [Myxococcales bacterium]|nr:hypothetical protein [Myxococcales bacterium]